MSELAVTTISSNSSGTPPVIKDSVGTRQLIKEENENE